MKLEFSLQICEEFSNKFHENPFGGSRVVLNGRTGRVRRREMMKLIVTFLNFCRRLWKWLVHISACNKRCMHGC